MIEEKTVYQKRVDRARRPNPVKADRQPTIVYRCRVCSSRLGHEHQTWCYPADATYLAEVVTP